VKVVSLLTNSGARSLSKRLFVSLFLFIPSLVSAVTAEKVPGDVYIQVQQLAGAVQALRKKQKIATPWPQVKVETGHKPRHVFQKALEILSKIDRYRINVLKMGGITVPHFPGRDITPNEVFNLVVRLRQELNLLVGASWSDQPRSKWKYSGDITPNHVYAALFEISIALEETLGLRSINPSEVYMRSQQVVERVQFLRRSQGFLLSVPKSDRTEGKLPNHALSAVRELQEKIQQAERNLWVKPLELPVQVRRVIKPSDVYDAMGVVMAELQRIQFRLGLEREFSQLKQYTGKTPDDVIQNVRWAIAMLPLFELDRPLQQYDRQALKKTSNQVYSITERILGRLNQYRQFHGIQVPAREVRMIHGLKPQHVFNKGLEILEKVDVLRRRQNMGPMAVPHYPLRAITPSEVFDLTLRLDNELTSVYEFSGEQSELWDIDSVTREHTNKRPSDVFFNMQRISNIFDTLLGIDGFTSDDVYREVLSIKQSIQLIADTLGEVIPEKSWAELKIRSRINPSDVLLLAGETLDLIIRAKRRAGMFGGNSLGLSSGKTVTPSDVFNQVRLMEAELNELMVFLDIDTLVSRPPIQNNKTPAHVLQALHGVNNALRYLMRMEVTSK